ncbi:MAG: dihydroorotate dehydrogenase electron transfer subunit [Endomicrobium sp.]|jgi:dihydroorotate dehydrogenase electron transfer subunit|nr:dihydroorotate dehydrogenase electron transfer subunit [Endomicrobium sp.]
MCTSKRFDKSYKIISNEEVCTGYFELKVKAEAVSKFCYPGQFFMIDIPEVFLRRPISIHSVEKGTISFLYSVVGRGTQILSKMGRFSGRGIFRRREGKDGCDEIKMLGPLGRGYGLTLNASSKFLSRVSFDSYGKKSCPKSRDIDFNSVIVAGGTGIASIHFLATKLSRKGILYYGVRSKKDLLCLDKFKKMGWKIVVSTEDGSKGYKGYVTDVLSENLRDNDTLFACGPVPMLKKVLQIAREKNVKGFVCLEEKMACGIGNCQGCAVKINGENKLICKDGPVFEIKDVEL